MTTATTIATDDDDDDDGDYYITLNARPDGDDYGRVESNGCGDDGRENLDHNGDINDGRVRDNDPDGGGYLDSGRLWILAWLRQAGRPRGSGRLGGPGIR